MIILIEDTEFAPAKCADCKWFFARVKGQANGEPTEAYLRACVALRKPVEDVSRLLPDCPIKYMPARFKPSAGACQDPAQAYQNGLTDGWNSCVDAIERD